MVQTSQYHPAIVELARTGNFRAIAHWLNLVLQAYGMRAYVGSAKPGCLKVLVELHPSLRNDEGLAGPWQESLVRFVCHRIWKLNSALIEGIRIAARFAGEHEILWERSVKLVTPARKQRQQQSRQLRTQIRQTARRKAQLKTMRVLLMSGSTVFAFVIGAIVAYVKAPVDQSSATSGVTPISRNNVVQAALGPVTVIKHNAVAEPREPTVTLMFGGDVTLANSFVDTIGTNYKSVFSQMDEYRKADLAMVNLENPLTRANTQLAGKQFNFKADPSAVEVLKDGGIDIANLANNHTMDYEANGLEETVKTLDDAKILHVGAGNNIAEARRPEIVDVKGQRIAYFGYYGDEYAATDKAAGTSPIQEAHIAQDIKAIRDQVDWVVVNYHWGQENAEHPAPWQVDLAHFTIDQGADLVVGHHPHVLQGAEIYKGRPIAYSLGNFIFGGNSRSDYDTAVLKVAIKDKQMKVEFVPVEVRGYQPKVASGDRGDAILQQIVNRSTEFKQPMNTEIVLDTRQPAPPEAAAVPVPSPTSSTAPAPTPSADSAPASPAAPEATTPTPAASIPAASTPAVSPSAPEMPTAPSAPSAADSGSPADSTSPSNPSLSPAQSADTSPASGSGGGAASSTPTTLSPSNSHSDPDAIVPAPELTPSVNSGDVPSAVPTPIDSPSGNSSTSTGSFTDAPNRTPFTSAPPASPSDGSPSDSPPSEGAAPGAIIQPSPEAAEPSSTSPEAALPPTQDSANASHTGVAQGSTSAPSSETAVSSQYSQ